MTVATGCAAMVNTTAAFLCDTRVRTLVACKPIIYRMALGAIQTEHACMECRVAMTV